VAIAKHSNLKAARRRTMGLKIQFRKSMSTLQCFWLTSYCAWAEIAISELHVEILTPPLN